MSVWFLCVTGVGRVLDVWIERMVVLTFGVKIIEVVVQSLHEHREKHFDDAIVVVRGIRKSKVRFIGDRRDRNRSTVINVGYHFKQ